MNSLPQALKSEDYVLGAVLRNGDLLSDILEVLPDGRMFCDGRHRHVFGAMTKLYSRNEPVTLDTVLAHLRNNGGNGAVDSTRLIDLCQNTIGARDPALYHARIVAQKYGEREVYLAAGEIQRRIDEGDVDDVRAWAGERIYEAGRVEPPTPGLWQQVQGALDLIDRGDGQELVRYPWGLPHLDESSTGIRLGRTTIVAALRKAGKSKFLVRIISELLTNEVPVLFFSLEMKSPTVLHWLASYREGIDSLKFETNNLTDDEIERVGKSLAAIATQNKLVICDRSHPSIGEIRQEIRREIKRRGIKVVFLDFVQRGNVEQQRGESRATALQRYAYALADTARDYQVALIMAAQLSNEAERAQSLHMGMIKESGGLPEAADVILFLDNKRRREHKTTFTKDGESGIDLIVEGQRCGVSGFKIPLLADLRHGWFREDQEKLLAQRSRGAG